MACIFRVVLHMNHLGRRWSHSDFIVFPRKFVVLSHVSWKPHEVDWSNNTQKNTRWRGRRHLNSTTQAPESNYMRVSGILSWEKNNFLLMSLMKILYSHFANLVVLFLTFIFIRKFSWGLKKILLMKSFV